jgi:hypothetical protein
MCGIVGYVGRREAEKIAQAVERSKAKDDERGVRIIADYAVVHPTASQDEDVKRLMGLQNGEADLGSLLTFDNIV